MTNTLQPKKRIEYLDALRGFTMILVVINHVALVDFGVNVYSDNTFHAYLQQFRMPLFFFVSGFVFYKKDFIWNFVNSLKFIKKKIPVQIISPFIFLLFFIIIRDKSFISAITRSDKLGYWFTFTLFEYFLIYIMMQGLFLITKINNSKVADIILLTTALALCFSYKIEDVIPSYNTIWGFLGIKNLKYFLFFVLGTLVRKNFSRFEHLLDHTPLVLICVVFYFTTNALSDIVPNTQIIGFIKRTLLSICGIVIIFSMFRKYSDVFTKNTFFANALKFIGRRTLDIYLLHHFFFTKQIQELFPIFAEYDLQLIEFTVSLVISALIIVACLSVSCILRLSPTMAHFLFGAKKEK
jgi:fucose 4-O-acetylase-like acetyltransferase